MSSHTQEFDMTDIMVGDQILINDGSYVYDKIGKRGTITSLSYDLGSIILEIRLEKGDLIVVDSRHINFDTIGRVDTL